MTEGCRVPVFMDIQNNFGMEKQKKKLTNN